MVVVIIKYYVVGQTAASYERGTIRNNWNMSDIYSLLERKGCKANRVASVQSFRLDEVA
jgi:hypothetical protein